MAVGEFPVVFLWSLSSEGVFLGPMSFTCTSHDNTTLKTQPPKHCWQATDLHHTEIKGGVNGTFVVSKQPCLHSFHRL